MDYSFKFAQWENRGKAIRASLYLTEKENAPWVILCHGFTGHRIGPNYLFVSLCQHLASQGINAIAYDSAGCGESEGQFADMTITTLCSDLVSAYGYVQDKYSPSLVALLGHSFGGTVVALTLDRIRTDGLILISPLADIKKHIQTHEHILKQGKNVAGYYEYGPHEMRIDFLDELRECDPFSAFSKETIKKIILFQGDADKDIPVKESRFYVDKANEEGIDIEYHIVKDADHGFLTVPGRIFLKNTLVDWLKELPA